MSANSTSLTLFSDEEMNLQQFRFQIKSTSYLLCRLSPRQFCWETSAAEMSVVPLISAYELVDKRRVSVTSRSHTFANFLLIFLYIRVRHM